MQAILIQYFSPYCIFQICISSQTVLAKYSLLLKLYLPNMYFSSNCICQKCISHTVFQICISCKAIFAKYVFLVKMYLQLLKLSAMVQGLPVLPASPPLPQRGPGHQEDKVRELNGKSGNEARWEIRKLSSLGNQETELNGELGMMSYCEL